MTDLRTPVTPRLGGSPSPVTVRVVAVLVAMACAAAATFGVLWYLAANDEDLARAQARDAVLLDAQQAAINLITLDYEKAEENVDLKAQSSTGAVQEDFRTNRDRYIEAIKQAKRKTTAEAIDGAVAELNLSAGTARVLVGLDVRVVSDKGEQTTTRQRLQLAMTRTDEGWKVSNIGAVN